VARVDLHLHSTASDGRLSPEEIVRKAAELGLVVIGLADHDTVDGIVPALVEAQKFPELKVIPAVEVSTDVPSGEVHILGYFIDYTSHELAETLVRFRNSRKRRAQGMVAKLADLGIHIKWQRVKEIAGTGTIARPHIAQAMLEKGYISSIREAFTKYIGRDGPAYVEREKLTPAEAVELVLQSKGLPVMAHPLTAPEPEAMVKELKAVGLIGMETYYNGYTADEIEYLAGLAEKNGLIATGGSDYHGFGDSGETMMGGAAVPMESAERLMALAEKRALKIIKP
jgi:predicted metal-dependent phosphoesterase TrpH